MLNAAGPLTAVINLSGHPRVTLFDNVLVFSANFVLCLILVPRYGMTGASASTLIALCSVTLLQVGQVARLFRILPFRDDQLRALAAGVLAALATAAVDAPALAGRRSSRSLVGGALFLVGLHRGDRRAGRAGGDAGARAARPRSHPAPWVDLVERMGGIASPPTQRVDTKRRSVVDRWSRS